MEHKRLKQFPNYEIWEDGTVWRLPHRTINGTKLKWKKVKPYKAKNRYLEVSLHNAEGKRVRMYLHRLVYMAFFGEIPPHKEIDHIDGSRENNSVNNIRICNHRNNCQNPNSIARYRAANALDKGKFNREKMMAAKGEKREEELRERFMVMYRESGRVKVMEFMQRGHCGYYRAVRIIKEMTEKVSDKLTKSEDMM